MKMRLKLLSILVFGIVIFFKNYVIVIGQTKPVLCQKTLAYKELTILDSVSKKDLKRIKLENIPLGVFKIDLDTGEVTGHVENRQIETAVAGI